MFLRKPVLLWVFGEWDCWQPVH